MILRVILSPEDIRKVYIDRPQSIESLLSTLKSKLNIQSDFTLQYEDPEFDHELCNLTTITELPPEKATLKVNCRAPPSDSSQSDVTLDTAVMSSSSDSSINNGNPGSITASSRSQQWPVSFPIPSFSYDVELRLKRGNEQYAKDGSLLSLSKDVKSEILDKLATAIYSYKAYPSNEEFESVSRALTETHPCLKEPGSATGWYGWKISLKFKMGNFRSKLRDAGCPELTVTSEKCHASDRKKYKVKKPRRSETNFLPDLPAGSSYTALETERKDIQCEMTKKNPDWHLIDAAMEKTFCARRKEIVEDEPTVSEIRRRWPALFTQRQVALEFCRLVSIDLKRTFFEGLDKHLPRLLQLYTKRSNEVPELLNVLKCLDEQSCNQKKRGAVILGLPYYMREKPENVFKVCEPTDNEVDVVQSVKVGILSVSEDTRQDCAFPDDVVNMAVILEGEIVIVDLQDIPNAFVTLFGLLYALNISYPKELRYTFEVIQRIFMNIDGESCSAKVHGLKNKLMR
ncbi:sterile alpha motif domain-containing protein 3-like [Megalobrama amblycephala]|uniref:sterile alpha motif domain-containing protein 3-like n=1 Tax=Megalobrama amblycephala TaxID=75352 RepID=UPI0020142508|nr:sterile alpha motif domain-containing protein 3-like [Megalobrama amblycephala]